MISDEWKLLIQSKNEITYYKRQSDTFYEATCFSKGIYDYGLLLDYVFDMNEHYIKELKSKTNYKSDEDIIKLITGNEIFNYKGHPYSVKDRNELEELFKLRGIDFITKESVI